MSNFDFLKDFDSDLWKAGNRIEEQLNISPQGVKSDATQFLERVLTILMRISARSSTLERNFTISLMLYTGKD